MWDGNVLYTENLLSDTFSKVQFLVSENEDYQYTYRKQINLMQTYTNQLEKNPNVNLITHIYNTLLKPERVEYYDQYYQKLFVSHQYGQEIQGITQLAYFYIQQELLDLIKQRIPLNQILDIFDLRCFEIDETGHQIFQDKGMFTLLEFTQERKYCDVKWYDNQSDLYYISQTLVNKIKLLHENQLYISNINLNNISMRKVLNDGNQMYDNDIQIYLSETSGVTDNYYQISEYHQFYYPEDVDVDNIPSENQRKWLDLFTIGRVLQFIMFSSVKIETSAEKYLESTEKSINECLDLLSEKYEEELVEQVRIMLSPFNYETSSDQFNQLIAMQISRNNTNERINDNEKIVTRIITQQLKEQDYDIEQYTSQEILNFLEISNKFQNTATGIKICEYLDNKGQTYFESLQKYEEINYEKILLNMAEIFISSNKWTQALKYLLIVNKNPIKNQYVKMDVLTNLGNVTGKLKDYQWQSIQYYHESYELKINIYKTRNNQKVIDSMIGLGYQFILEKQFHESVKWYQQAVDAMNKLQYLQSDKKFTSTVSNLGLAYFHTKDYINSEKQFIQIQEILVKNGQMQTQEYADVLEKLGQVCSQSGEYEKSCKYFQERLDLINQIQSTPDKIATAYYQLASLQYNIVNQYPGKDDMAKQALINGKLSLEFLNKANSQDGQAISDCNKIIAHTYAQLGIYEESLQYFNKSLEILSNLYGPQDTRVLALKLEMQIKLDTMKQEKNIEIECQVLGKVFKQDPDQFKSIFEDNPQYTAQKIIEKISLGETKIQILNGTILDVFDMDDNMQYKEGCQKMQELFGGETCYNYLQLFKKNPQYTQQQIIQKIQNGTLTIEVQGKPLKTIQVQKEEEIIQKKKEIKMKSDFFPNGSYMKFNSYKKDTVHKKILELNEQIVNNDKNSQICLKPLEIKYLANLLEYIENGNKEIGENEIDIVKNKLINWPIQQIIPVFDLLRHLALKPEISRIMNGQSGSQVIQSACQNLEGKIFEKIPLITLFLSFFVNGFIHNSYTFLQKQDQILGSLLILLDNKENEVKNNLIFQRQLGKFYYNYSKALHDNSQILYKIDIVRSVLKQIYKGIKNVQEIIKDQQDLEDSLLEYLIAIAHILLAGINCDQQIIITVEDIQNLQLKNQGDKIENCQKDIINQIQLYNKVFRNEK